MLWQIQVKIFGQNVKRIRNLDRLRCESTPVAISDFPAVCNLMCMQKSWVIARKSSPIRQMARPEKKKKEESGET